MGVAVKVIKYCNKKEMVTIQSVEDSHWKSKRHISELRADGGWKEIDKALKTKGGK
tara:strand:+ start:402 stop:569 length:168 start_codon:yes stop_codon:yes gene_type:complete